LRHEQMFYKDLCVKKKEKRKRHTTDNGKYLALQGGALPHECKA